MWRKRPYQEYTQIENSKYPLRHLVAINLALAVICGSALVVPADSIKSKFVAAKKVITSVADSFRPDMGVAKPLDSVEYGEKISDEELFKKYFGEPQALEMAEFVQGKKDEIIVVRKILDAEEDGDPMIKVTYLGTDADDKNIEVFIRNEDSGAIKRETKNGIVVEMDYDSKNNEYFLSLTRKTDSFYVAYSQTFSPTEPQKEHSFIDAFSPSGEILPFDPHTTKKLIPDEVGARLILGLLGDSTAAMLQTIKKAEQEFAPPAPVSPDEFKGERATASARPMPARSPT